MLMFQQVLEHGEIAKEQRDKISFTKHFDAVVLGGGTAGSIAAIYLAKKGRHVLIVEKLNFLGGVHSGAMFHYYQGSPGGIYEAYDERIEQQKKQYRLPDVFGSHPLIRMCVYEQELEDTNCQVSFDSALTGVYVDGRTIAGIQYLTPFGLKEVSADYFIDATAEAALCRMAGSAKKNGREFDGLSQPFSNVRLFFEKDTCRMNFDNIDAGYVRQELAEEYANHIVTSLNNPVYSTWQNGQITMGMSPLLGVREGFAIDGIRQLRMDQVIKNQETLEPLFFSSANIDNHVKDMAFESQTLCDWVVGLSMWSTLVSVPIDKDVMIPNALDNVIAAGRILSLDHDMASHTRMMRDCQKSGEAAAAVVEEALYLGLPLQDVPYQALKDRLSQTNCLSIRNHYVLRDNPPPEREQITRFDSTTQQIRKGLLSNSPGFAMLAAWQMRIIEALKSWLTEDNNNLKVNSALVLALCGDDSGLSVLIETAQRRDCYLPQTSKSYNSLRGISAVYALGRLHSAAASEPLLQMLQQNETFINDSVRFDKFIGHMQDYRFQYVSHLVRALLTIADYHPDLCRNIYQEVEEIVLAPQFTVSCTLKSNPGCLHDMTGSLRNYIQWRKTKGGKRL